MIHRFVDANWRLIFCSRSWKIRRGCPWHKLRRNLHNRRRNWRREFDEDGIPKSHKFEWCSSLEVEWSWKKESMKENLTISDIIAIDDFHDKFSWRCNSHPQLFSFISSFFFIYILPLEFPFLPFLFFFTLTRQNCIRRYQIPNAHTIHYSVSRSPYIGRWFLPKSDLSYLNPTKKLPKITWRSLYHATQRTNEVWELKTFKVSGLTMVRKCFRLNAKKRQHVCGFS